MEGQLQISTNGLIVLNDQIVEWVI
jgi:hypothetical protein